MSKKTEHCCHEGGYGMCVSRNLKEELAWAKDKLFRIISNIMLFKTVIPLRN